MCERAKATEGAAARMQLYEGGLWTTITPTTVFPAAEVLLPA